MKYRCCGSLQYGLLLLIILFYPSCEKVKQEEVKPSYATNVSFTSEVYPIIQKSCASCHSDFNDISNAYNQFQTKGFNVLPGSPSVPKTKSEEYWRQMDSIVEKSTFYLFLKNSHKMVKIPEADKSIIYGWIIEGGKNN